MEMLALEYKLPGMQSNEVFVPDPNLECVLQLSPTPSAKHQTGPLQGHCTILDTPDLSKVEVLICMTNPTAHSAHFKELGRHGFSHRVEKIQSVGVDACGFADVHKHPEVRHACAIFWDLAGEAIYTKQNTMHTNSNLLM
jgi:hypothetical protein